MAQGRTRHLVVVALLASGIATTGGMSVASAADPQSAGNKGPSAPLSTEGRIAYVHNEKIVTINPDLTDKTAVVTKGKNAGPAWSPDGTKIAYIHNRELWIMDPNGSNQVKMTSGKMVKYVAPSWSPDGSQLVFDSLQGRSDSDCSTQAGCAGYNWGVLDTIDTDDPMGPVTTLMAEPGGGIAWEGAMGTEHGVSWSSSGDMIVFDTAYGALGQMIAIYHLDDQTVDDVWEADGEGTWGTLANPVFSPDSSLLAFDDHYDDLGGIHHRGIQLEDVDGPRYDLFEQRRRDSDLSFESTQTRVVYVHNNWIMVADLYGQNPVRVAHGSQPDWQPVP